MGVEWWSGPVVEWGGRLPVLRSLWQIGETCHLSPAPCPLKPATCILSPATCTLPPEACNLPVLAPCLSSAPIRAIRGPFPEDRRKRPEWSGREEWIYGVRDGGFLNRGWRGWARMERDDKQGTAASAADVAVSD